jgi:genome sequencing data, contig C250
MDKRGGVLISYATEPGQVARDGNGRNSPYTASLIKWMREPLTLESMLKRVANEVADATGNKQTPWYDTSLMADFYFTAPTEKQTAQSSESKLVSPQGTPIEQFKIDEELIQSYPELIALIINTESMEDDERQYWFDIMPSMNYEQIQRLYDILHTEKKKLAALEENFVTGIKALIAYTNEDYSRAFFLYRPLAENGDASAQYKLGLMYENGQGTKRDMEKAREWYEKAAANGDEEAKEALKNLL